MRRRSTLGTGAMAPIRPSDFFGPDFSSRPGRLSVQPRQLDFAKTSQTVDTTKPKKQNVVTGDRSRRSRFSCLGAAIYNTSVMDPVLNETVPEVAGDGNDAEVSSRVSTVPATRSPSTNQKSFSTNQKSFSTNQKSFSTYEKSHSINQKSSSINQTDSTTRQKSSAALTETAPIAEFNSTATFEEEEIIVLSATPHPDRYSKCASSGRPPVAESSAVAEQMQLFILDQRNLMHVMKLSFQKMNAVMDQMSVFMGKMNDMVDTQCELKLKHKNVQHLGNLPPGSTDSTDNDSPKLSELSDKVVCMSDALASTFIDNKENVHALSKSFAEFTDMKSKLNCLKTPTRLRTKPSSADTPNTILSNRVSHQLDDLFECSDIDE